MQKALFIYNPVAGRKKLRPELWEVIRVLSKKYFLTVMETQRAGDGQRFIAHARNTDFDAVICCGGDGTLNEVINGMLENDVSVPIGYIPCGSTNDFAKSLQIPTDTRTAARNIMLGRTKSIDIGLCNDLRYFSYIASFGAFTEASYNTPQNAKNLLGHTAYIFRGVKDFLELKKSPVYRAEISTFEGDSIQGEYFFGAICNSTSIGGTIRLPDASVDFGDGLFEVVFVRKPKSRKEWFSLLDDIVHKRIEKNPLVDMRKTSGVNIKMEDRINWTIDGEKMTADTTISVANKKQAIKIFI
ncbi:MAG: diacylglycerol kinase family lipid kinase [Clostridia bacterium]|nr:diacylglycerol kinase family lipid kinase [Clostridia bacterium]